MGGGLWGHAPGHKMHPPEASTLPSTGTPGQVCGARQDPAKESRLRERDVEPPQESGEEQGPRGRREPPVPGAGGAGAGAELPSSTSESCEAQRKKEQEKVIHDNREVII